MVVEYFFVYLFWVLFVYLSIFFTHSLVYFVVIVRACLFVVLAIVAIVMSHSCWRLSWLGRGGMMVYLWFLSVSIMGCVCQCIVCFARRIVFLIR